MKTLFILSFFIWGVLACSSKPKNQPEPTWMGKTKHQLIEKYGLPNEKMPDGNGGEVFIYKKVETKKVYGTGEKQDLTIATKYFLDSSGKVYQIKVD